MRPLFIAGNWKMNPPSKALAQALALEIKQGVGAETTPRVALCPPSVYLHAVDEVLSGSPIGLGAQNMNAQAEGAYTGELGGPMLVDAGCTHVILGHSERRHGMGETNAQVNEKLFAALKVGLIPIVCIGETLAEREAEETEAVVAFQLAGSLAGIDPEVMGGIVLAYEPVWAIGTGKVATPVQAQAGPLLHPRLGDRRLRASDRRPPGCPVWGEREGRQRPRAALLPRHRRRPRGRGQPEADRVPRDHLRGPPGRPHIEEVKLVPRPLLPDPKSP